MKIAPEILKDLSPHEETLWGHYRAAVATMNAAQAEITGTNERLAAAERDVESLSATLTQAETALTRVVEIGDTEEETRLDAFIEEIKGRLHRAKQKKGILEHSASKKEKVMPQLIYQLQGTRHAFIHSVLLKRAEALRTQLEPVFKVFDLLAAAGDVPIFDPGRPPWTLWQSHRHDLAIQAEARALVSELEAFAVTPATE